MSTEPNDGGPAFPCQQGHTPDGTWNQTFETGMSLRDWFAGQALAGRNVSRSYENWDDMAMDCYEIADAMLKARQSNPTP